MVACDTIAGWGDVVWDEVPDNRDTATAGGRRLMNSSYISAWQSGRRGGKSDGCGGAGPVRSYLTTMRRSYQRDILRAGGQWHASCEANLCGVHPVWLQIRAHFRRGLSNVVACDTTACREDAVLDEAPDSRVRMTTAGVRLKDSGTISAWHMGGGEVGEAAGAAGRAS